MLSEMLAVRERIYKSNHPHIATTLNSLAHVAKGKGDLKLAEWRFRRAAGIYGIAYGESHHFVGVALSNAGAVLLEKGDSRGAEQLLRNVRGRFLAILASEHLDLAVVRARLGRALLQQRKFAEAESECSIGLTVLDKDSTHIGMGLHGSIGPCGN